MTDWDYEAAFALAYPPEPITWEQYMAEEYLRRRFDILDGIRYFYLSQRMEEGDIRGNLTLLFRNVERQTHCGKVMFA